MGDVRQEASVLADFPWQCRPRTSSWAVSASSFPCFPSTPPSSCPATKVETAQAVQGADKQSTFLVEQRFGRHEGADRSVDAFFSLDDPSMGEAGMEDLAWTRKPCCWYGTATA